MTSSRVSGLRLDAILSQAREPAFLLGPDRRLIGLNRAFEELTGHPAEKLVGLACGPHGPTRPGDLGGLGGSLSPPPEAFSGRPVTALTLFLVENGEPLRRRIEFHPFHADDGALLAVLGLVRPADEPVLVPDSAAQRLRTELLAVRAGLIDRYGFETLIGRGPAHRRLLDQVKAVATSGASALIVGEPGTGKKTVARSIHALGPTRLAPILPFDCSALPPEVLSRELFGPTDDEDDPPNLDPVLVQADGASLLLFDVVDLPRDIQARLARTLDGRVRLLATTAIDPDAALRDDRLRTDFYYAITSIVLRLPPLRDRIDELPLLAQHFLERANRRAGHHREGFTVECIESLTAYDWPGNLRELSRVVDAAHEAALGSRIGLADLPTSIRGDRGGAYLPPRPSPAVHLDEVLTRVERRLIEQSLVRARHNKSRAAELLGISRPRLYRRIKELGMLDESEPATDTAPSADGRS